MSDPISDKKTREDTQHYSMVSNNICVPKGICAPTYTSKFIITSKVSLEIQDSPDCEPIS